MGQASSLPYRPEVLINFGSNLLMSIANSEAVAQSLAKYKFIVSIDLFVTETSRLRRHRAARLQLPAVARFALQLPVHLQPSGRHGRMVLADPPAGAAARGRAARRSPTCCSSSPTASASAPTCNAAYNASLDLEAPIPARRRPALQLRGDLRRRAEEQLRRRARPRLVQAARRDRAGRRSPRKSTGGRSSTCACRSTGSSCRRWARQIAAIAEPRGLKIPREYYRAAARFPALPVARAAQTPGFDLYAFYYRDIAAHQQLHHGEPVARRGGAARSVLLHHRHQRRDRREARASRTASSSGSRPRPAAR